MQQNADIKQGNFYVNNLLVSVQTVPQTKKSIMYQKLDALHPKSG